MSTHVTAVRDSLDGPRIRQAKRTVVEVAFGDSVGLTVFCAVLAFYVLTWRIGAFINDIGLFVVLLNRVAAGQLSLGQVGDIGTIQPGMYRVGSTVYGRNYGQIVASLPAYWLVDALGPRLFRWVVVVGWSGLVGAVVTRVTRHRGRGRRVTLAAGGVVALVALGANAAAFKPLTAGAAIVALQATAMLAAAATAVLVYRLVARQSGPRLGVLAGAAVAVATPVGFWATVPKRHAFTALLVVVALSALARSREDEHELEAARLGQAGFRAMAYASAGLLAWVHAPEGFTLFFALAVVDLPTAPRNDARTLAIVGGAFALSLAPFLVTNYLVAGNPVQPPRFLPSYNGLESVADDITSSTGDSIDTGPAEGTGTGPFGGFSPTVLLPATLVTLLQRGLFQYVEGVVVAVTDPDRLVTVFVRWGRHGYEPTGIFFGEGTNLSVLEAAPLAAVVAVAPFRYGIERVRSWTGREPGEPPGDGDGRSLSAVDAFALVFAGLLVALYLPQLPTHIMVTARYLHPIYPLLVYAAVRQRWLLDALDGHARVALWGYEAAVLLGTPLVVGALFVSHQLPKGDFFQTFGLVALVFAGLLAACSLGSLSDRFDPRISAGVAGLTAGVVTVFLLLTAFVVMHYGMSALPFVDTVTGDLRFAILRNG